MGNHFDAGDMLAKIKPSQCPHRQPKGAAEGVEDEKTPPIHFQHAVGDAVQLTQDIDESCESDGYRTVSCEKRFHSVEANGVYTDLAPVAQDNGAAKTSSNEITNTNRLKS
jgi:hypothetical protein